MFYLIEYQLKKLKPTDVNFGNLKRQILCICIDPLDKFGYYESGTHVGEAQVLFQRIEVKK